MLIKNSSEQIIQKSTKEIYIHRFDMHVKPSYKIFVKIIHGAGNIARVKITSLNNNNLSPCIGTHLYVYGY